MKRFYVLILWILALTLSSNAQEKCGYNAMSMFEKNILLKRNKKDFSKKHTNHHRTSQYVHNVLYIDDGIAFLKPIWAPNDNGIFTLKTSDNEYSILLPWSEKCLEIKIPQYLNGEATIIIETSDAFYSATTII